MDWVVGFSVAVLRPIACGPDLFCSTTGKAYGCGDSCVTIPPVSMRIGEFNASMQFSNSLLCGCGGGVNLMPVVMAAGKSSTVDADEKYNRENQSNGFFHDMFLLKTYVLQHEKLVTF